MSMEDAVLQTITSTVASALLVSALIFLLKNIILTRLKGAVKHEHDVKLEALKNQLRKDTERDLKEIENTLKKKSDIDIAQLNQRLTIEYDRLKYSFKEEAKILNKLWPNIVKVIHVCAQFNDSPEDHEKLEKSFTSLECFIFRKEPFIDSEVMNLTKYLIEITNSENFSAERYKDILEVRTRIVIQIRNRLHLNRGGI